MKKALLIFSIILTLSLPITVFAADNLYRLMHNDQQALVIAEVVESNDELTKFQVKKSIVSEQDLNISSKIEQLELDSFTLRNEDLSPIKFYENVETKDAYNQGDIYLISLNEKEDGYEIAWGIYELSSSDYESLDVLHPKNSPQWRIMEAMAIKEFVNTDGRKSEFTFDGDNKTLKSGDRVIYDGKSVDTEEEKMKDIVNNEELEDLPRENKDEIKESTEPEEVSQSKGYENLIYIVLAIVILILLLKGKIGT